MQKYELNKEKSYCKKPRREIDPTVEEKSRARRLLCQVRLFQRTNAKSTMCVCVCVCVCVCAQSHPILCNPIVYSQPGSSVYGVFQARILEQFPFLSPGHLLNPGTEHVSLVSPALTNGFFATMPSKSSPGFCSKVYVSALAIRTARLCIWNAGFTFLIADLKTNLSIFLIIHSHNVSTSKTEPFKKSYIFCHSYIFSHSVVPNSLWLHAL